jgi:hypothetical protein
MFFVSFIFFIEVVIHVLNRVSEGASTNCCMSLLFLLFYIFYGAVIHVINRVSEVASTNYCMSLLFF